MTIIGGLAPSQQKAQSDSASTCWARAQPTPLDKTSLTRRFQSRFEQQLNTPVKSRHGDEAYWQYQDKLQQSALSFQAMEIHKTLEANQTVLKPSCAENTTQASITQAPTSIAGYNNVQQQDALTPKEITLQTINTNKTQPTITTMNNSLPLLTSEGEIETEDLHPLTRSPCVSGERGSQEHAFKNHHLFLNDNQAEIALNTTQFTQAQTRELQKLIKQNLTQQGFLLKKLIINGVLQW